MKITYKLSHILVGCMLLVSLFLQSCTNFSNAPVPKVEERTGNIPRSTKLIVTNQLVGKELIAAGGHVVTFYEEAGELKASVEENLPTGFNKTCTDLPVYMGEDIDPAQMVKLEKKQQERPVEVKLPTSGQVGHVYIGKRGLLGGRMDGQGKEK